MEDLSVCKVCNQKYTYTEYQPWTPEGVLGSALGKIKGVKIGLQEKRDVICACGTYPEVKITYEHDNEKEAPVGIYTPFTPMQITNIFKKDN